MKTLTTIDIQGDRQDVWEVYCDESREQTFGFIFGEDNARLVEDMLELSKRLDQAWEKAAPAVIPVEKDKLKPFIRLVFCGQCPFMVWETDNSMSNHSGCARCSKLDREIAWDDKSPRIPEWCPLPLIIMRRK